MKGNSKIKQWTVFLIAYVLVIGFVGTSGLVDGQTNSDTSDVSLEASAIEAKVEITNLTIVTNESFSGSNTTHYIIEEDVDGNQVHNYQAVGKPEWIDTIKVEVNVSVASGTPINGNINYTYVDIWTDQGNAVRETWNNPGDAAGVNTKEVMDGDAHNMYGVLWGDDQFTTSENYTRKSYTWDETDSTEAGVFNHLLRAGGSNEWEAEAYVLDEEGGSYTDNPTGSDTDGSDDTFDVATFTYITVENAPSTPTVAPGTTAEPADFGNPQLNFTINAAWRVTNETFTLKGPDGSTDVTLDDTDAGYNSLGTYEQTGGSPTANNEDYVVYYQVYVPAGTPSGTYSGIVTHNLYDTDV